MSINISQLVSEFVLYDIIDSPCSIKQLNTSKNCSLRTLLTFCGKSKRSVYSVGINPVIDSNLGQSRNIC